MKKADIAILIFLPLVIFLAIFLVELKINYFVSLLLFFGIPSLYLSLKNDEKIQKVGLFSILVSIPIAIIFELVAFGDKGWFVPESIAPYRIFSLIPLEDFIWMFLVTYTILIFYESFCNTKFQKSIDNKIKLMIYTLYPLTFLLVALFFISPSLLNIPYFYLWAGIILFLIPIILFLLRYPRLFRPFLKTSVFFFYIHLLFEIVGLKLNHWTFTGDYFIGWVPIWV